MSFFSEQVLVGQYTVNKEGDNKKHTATLSIPAFLTLAFFLVFSPGWLWIYTMACAASILLLDDGFRNTVRQTWLGCVAHYNSRVEKSTDPPVSPSTVE